MQVKMPDRPAIVEYSTEEGGEWKSIKDAKPRSVFALRFADGTIVDPIAGWRMDVDPDIYAAIRFLNYLARFRKAAW